MFLTGVWHLDHDLDVLRNHAYIFPEDFILLRSVKAKIEVLVEVQISSDKLCQGRVRGSGSWFEVRDRSAQADPISLSWAIPIFSLGPDSTN